MAGLQCGAGRESLSWSGHREIAAMPAFKVPLAAVLAAAAVLALPAAGLAQPASKPAGQCFLSSAVDGFAAPDDHTVYIRVGVSDVYRLDLMVDCSGLTFRQGIGLESTSANSWICSPLDATVVYHETGMPERCPVKAIRKLTADEIKALPKRDRP
jgi:hypothetical protein